MLSYLFSRSSNLDLNVTIFWEASRAGAKSGVSVFSRKMVGSSTASVLFPVEFLTSSSGGSGSGSEVGERSGICHLVAGGILPACLLW